MAEQEPHMPEQEPHMPEEKKKKKRRKRKKNSWQLGEIQRLKRERLAKKGEAWPVYESLLAEPVFQGSSLSLGVKWDKEFALLYSALQRRAHDNPDQFSADVLARIMSCATYLWARASYQLACCIQEVDERSRGAKTGSSLNEWTWNVLVTRLLKLGQYIAEMAQSQAATTRQWALTRAKLPENEDAASQPARKKRRRAQTPTESQPVVDVQAGVPTNGTAAAHPPATAISIGDRRGDDGANEHLVSYLIKLRNEMYGT
jgi:hypothetical protein